MDLLIHISCNTIGIYALLFLSLAETVDVFFNDALGEQVVYPHPRYVVAIQYNFS